MRGHKLGLSHGTFAEQSFFFPSDFSKSLEFLTQRTIEAQPLRGNFGDLVWGGLRLLNKGMELCPRMSLAMIQYLMLLHDPLMIL